VPTLNWLGKDAVLNHHSEVPFRTLELKESFNCETGKSKNKIIHGDNLEALKALLPKYEGRVKCIYIDPPYNTKSENWVYNDNVNSPKIRKWLGQVVGKEFEDLTRHDKWLCMMYPRLKLLQKLLADEGVIFISIDDHEQASLKLICDEIFGIGNFIGIFSWVRKKKGSFLSKTLRKMTEYVYCYKNSDADIEFYGENAYSDKWQPIVKRTNNIGKLSIRSSIVETTLPDGSYEQGFRGNEGTGITFLNPFVVENGKITNDINVQGRFVWSQEFFEKEISNGTRISLSNKFGFNVLRFNQDSKTKTPSTLINEFNGVGTNEDASSNLQEIFNSGLNEVFQYSKPFSLVQYLITMLCKDDPNAIILDSFAGSGTTAHAVLNLNKQDGGNRKFILVEMEDYADKITAERVRRVIKGYKSDEKRELYSKELTLKDIANGQQIMDELKGVRDEHKDEFDKFETTFENNCLKLAGITKGRSEGTGGDFCYYELGPEMLLDGYLNEAQPVEKIREYIYYTETNKSIDYQRVEQVGHEFFLGDVDNTSYYLFYKKSEVTTLDFEFLATIKLRSERYVIFADNCVLSKDFLFEHNITFRKIPRDVRKF
jgi:adenine-specific DNA-methyltransferase